MLGTTLGSYRIERELGRGGMGVVYAGTHTLLGRTAAIKVLLAKYSEDQNIVQRFFNEARAAAAIKHPGIIEIYDFGYATDQTGCAYIVMERCDGESLASRLRRQRTLSMASALTIARHIAGTLAAAHKAGIVHRDLKPDNVFVVPDPDVPGGERIKLLDFGIAKLASSTSLTKTSTGVIMGTPFYMSPEQCRGAGHVDHRSDLYALGCILFEMLCGRVPFIGEGAGDLISLHMMIAPPTPSSLAPQVPPDVESLILRLLAKKPADRPQSAEAVADELQRLAANVSPTVLAAARVELAHGVEATMPSDRPIDGAAETVASSPEKSAGLDATAAETPPPSSAPSTPPARPAVAASPEVARPRRRIAVIIGGAVTVAGLTSAAIVMWPRSNGESTTKNTTALTPSDAVPAPVDAPSKRIDDRARVLVGPLSGAELTEAMRTRIRPAIAKQLQALAPELRVVLAEDDATGDTDPALLVDGSLTTLEADAGKLRCKFALQLLSHPEKDAIAFINGGASVTVGKSLKDIDAAAADCVDAVLEDLLKKKIVPAAREHMITQYGSFQAPGAGLELTQDRIRQAFHAHVARIEECYSIALEKDPKLTATVMTHFTIGTNGRVSKESVEGVDKEFASCITEVLRSMAFSPFPKEPIDINYPFAFRPAEN